MKKDQVIGFLLIAGAIGVFIPYTVLTMTFDYPDILRQDPGTILTRFHGSGSSLIFTWWAFAILGLPLLIAYIMIGERLDKTVHFIKWITVFGIISGIVQIIGLLRWVFVVPVIAGNYVSAADDAAKTAAVGSFQTIHQFGGVLLGEHLGQLFTITWTIGVCVAFIKLNIFARWVSGLGIIASLIYLLAQAELFATVIPGFPFWGLAGFLGSTLWLVWLIVLGIQFVKLAKKN